MPETIDEIRARVSGAQKDYIGNLMLLEGILQNERGYVAREPYKEDVVVLCSGGLDSVVMINKLIEENESKIHPLFIRRGARAGKLEENAFDFFMNFYKKRFPENIKEEFKMDYSIPPKEFKENIPESMILSIGHPLRNSTMQNLGVMYAVSLQSKGYNVKSIFSATTKDDSTEPEQGLLSLRAQTLNTCVQLGDWDWQITSPLIDNYLVDKQITKADLIQYALNKFIPLEKTRTCFSKEETADGTCFACQKRLAAFESISVPDPLKYETREVKIAWQK
jgi:7-cyano-7-deazaguanine synthase